MRPILLIACGCSLGLWQPGHAQAPSLPPGTRIRVTLRFVPFADAHNAPRIGRLIAMRADSLVLRADGVDTTAAYSVRDVRALHVSAGLAGHRLRRARQGFLVGAVIGAVLGATAGSDAPCDQGGGCYPRRYTAAQKAVVAGLGVGLFGSAVGAVLGSGKSERWVATSLPTTASGLGPGMPYAVGIRVALHLGR